MSGHTLAPVSGPKEPIVGLLDSSILPLRFQNLDQVRPRGAVGRCFRPRCAWWCPIVRVVGGQGPPGGGRLRAGEPYPAHRGGVAP